MGKVEDQLWSKGSGQLSRGQGFRTAIIGKGSRQLFRARIQGSCSRQGFRAVVQGKDLEQLFRASNQGSCCGQGLKAEVLGKGSGQLFKAGVRAVALEQI